MTAPCRLTWTSIRLIWLHSSHKISQSKDSSDQCDSFNDTTATYPSTKRDAKVKVILPVE